MANMVPEAKIMHEGATALASVITDAILVHADGVTEAVTIVTADPSKPLAVDEETGQVVRNADGTAVLKSEVKADKVVK